MFLFSIYWECHHPNWRTPSFFRGVGIPPTRIHVGNPPGRIDCDATRCRKGVSVFAQWLALFGKQTRCIWKSVFFAESCIKSVTFGFICNVARTWCSFSGMQESSQPWLGGHGNFKSMAFSCILHTGSWYVFRCGLLHGSTVKHHYSGWWNIDWLLRPNRNPAFQKELMNTNPPDMYIYIYNIYMYTVSHVYIYIYTYTYIQTYTHVYKYDIHTYIHIHTYTYTHRLV